MFWWSASITLDNNNVFLIDFYPFISLYTLLHTSVSLTGCIPNAFSVLKILTHLTTMLPFGSLLTLAYGNNKIACILNISSTAEKIIK